MKNILMPCLKGGLLDMSIVFLFVNYWSWSALGWIMLTTTIVWAARIILNVFLRKRLTKLTRYLKTKFLSQNKENETKDKEKQRKKELF